MSHWKARASVLPLPKVEDEGATGGGGLFRSSPSSIGSSDKRPSTATTEVRQLLHDTSRWNHTPPSTPQNTNENGPSCARYAAQEATRLEPIQFCDGDEALNGFPDALKAQLEQACREQDTDLPSCIRLRWAKTHTSIRFLTDSSHTWYDYKTGQELLVARFYYGTRHQILIAKYAVEVDPLEKRGPFIITWVGGAWRRWDLEGYINEPQHIERKVGIQTGNAGIDHKSSSVQFDAGDFDGDNLVAERADGAWVQLKCHRCDAQTYSTQRGLFLHLRYSHGVLLKNYEEMIKVCSQVVRPAPRHSTRAMKRKRTSISPSASQKTQIKHYTTRYQRETVSSPTKDKSSLNADTAPDPATADEIEINFIFKSSDDDKTPRIRPLSSCDTIGKLMAHALVAGIADKNTLMFTVKVNGIPPIYVMRSDAVDFDRVINAIEDRPEKNIAVVVTVENWC